MTAALKGYRTLAFNLIMPGLMILAATGIIGPGETPDAESVNVFLDNLEGVFTAVWAIGNIVLRKVTTGPMGTKI